MSDLEERIVKRLEELALEAFDPDEAEDSDGYDQAEHAGLTTAAAVVREEFAKEATPYDESDAGAHRGYLG